MAVTKIHSIALNADKALAYIMSDKHGVLVLDCVHPQVCIEEGKTPGDRVYKTLTTCHMCVDEEKPENDFNRLAYHFGFRELIMGSNRTKDGKTVVAHHLIQSFEAQISPELANRIGVELAEMIIPDHPCVISTHCNTYNTHNHLVFSAFSWEGKKYNSCHKTYQHIRDCSDELCIKYGLPVMEDTRQQKLLKWRDSEGKIHYYEPTERKERIREARAANKTYNDDVGSYRHSYSYEYAVQGEEEILLSIQSDIDDVLNYANSFEHFLELMEARDYTIRSRKKDGDWLQNISYRSPASSRAVRDIRLGPEYTREQLSEEIRRRVEERARLMEQIRPLNLPEYEHLGYREFDVQRMHDTYRLVTEWGTTRVMLRKESEKPFVSHIKEMDAELVCKYDTTAIRRMIEEQRLAEKKKKPPVNRDEELIRQIQESFKCLKIMEQTNVVSRVQLDDRIRSLENMLRDSEKELEYAKEMLMMLDEPEKVKEFSERIEELEDMSHEMLLELEDFSLCRRTWERIDRDRMRHLQENNELRTKPRRRDDFER